jgi:hypothetical protein
MDLAPNPAQIVPARRQSAPTRPVRGEVLHVAMRPLAPAKSRAADSLDPEAPPSWWEPQADEDWRRKVWADFPADYRNRLLAQRVGAAFTVRPPEGTDAVILWSQYHALKALAVRLDAGIAAERERAAFEAGLREYNGNFERVREERQRKLLPG